jgi:hypothetical protein
MRASLTSLGSFTGVLVRLLAPLVVGSSSLMACGGASTCTPATCRSGCCDAAGVCQSGQSALACGAVGNACQACASGSLCVSGSCSSLSAGGSGNTGGASGGGSPGTGSDLEDCVAYFRAGNIACGVSETDEYRRTACRPMVENYSAACLAVQRTLWSCARANPDSFDCSPGTLVVRACVMEQLASTRCQ